MIDGVLKIMSNEVNVGTNEQGFYIKIGRESEDIFS